MSFLDTLEPYNIYGKSGFFGRDGIFFGGQNRDRSRRKREELVSGLFQNSLAGDPLYNLANQADGPLFNAKDLFRQGSAEIESVSRRRNQESLQSLAGFGIDPNSAQASFLGDNIERGRIRQLGALSGFINQAQSQYGSQAALQSTAQASQGLLGFKQLQVGAT